MSLTEIAKRIDAHLKRFEADPAVNPNPGSAQCKYWRAGAHRGGTRVMVKYISFQGASGLTREQAEKYLAWLDAGNAGSHYEAFR